MSAWILRLKKKGKKKREGKMDRGKKVKEESHTQDIFSAFFLFFVCLVILWYKNCPHC